MTTLGEVATRFASLTSVVRTRGEDDTRTKRNGGTNGTLARRQKVAVDQLKRDLAKFEKAIS